MLARILLRNFTIQFASDLGWAQIELKFLKKLGEESSNYTRGDDRGTFVPLIGHQVEVSIRFSLLGYCALSLLARSYICIVFYQSNGCFMVNIIIITPCWHWHKNKGALSSRCVSMYDL